MDNIQQMMMKMFETFREDFNDMKKSVDELKDEVRELRHKENNTLMKMQKEFCRKEELRPLIREVFDDHGVVREKELWGYFKDYTEKYEASKLEKLNKKSETIKHIISIVQIVFPIFVALMLVLGVGAEVYEKYNY